MSKFLTAFFEMKNEAEATKRFALGAITVVTISLAALSICGAWAMSEGDWLAFIPRFFYALLVFGLEMLAPCCSSAPLSRPTGHRRRRAAPCSPTSDDEGGDDAETRPNPIASGR